MKAWRFVWRKGMVAALVMAASLACGPPAVSAGGPSPEQTTVTLIAVADASVESDAPDLNQGGADYLFLTNWPGLSPTECALVQFHLAPAVPPNAAIDSARLELRCVLMRYVEPNNPFPVSVAARFVTSAWDEMTVTWNTRPSTSGWEARTDVHWGIGGWQGWNATGFTRAWQANPASNHGLEVCGIPDTARYGLTYVSREWDEASWRPRLVVTYRLTGPLLVRLPLVLRTSIE